MILIDKILQRLGGYPMDRLFKGDLMGVLPEYVEHRGNCTKVYLRNSDPFILDKSIKTVIRLIGKHYMIDLNEIKKRYKQILSSTNLIPIPLSQEDVFVPFKTRKPMYKNDGAFGYINIKYIEDVKDEKKSRKVYLENGHAINCLCSLSTIENHIKNGYVISKCYESRNMKVSESEEIYKAFIPATKADIEMLQKQLIKIAKGSNF